MDIKNIISRMFNKRYELPLSRNYVSSWGVWEACRELIQNAIDCENYDIRFEDDSLVIRSYDGSLTPQTLVLGNSTKSDDSSKIGKFGEGYKLALLVLTREEFPVFIQNGNLGWRPEFVHSEVFDSEVFGITEYKLKKDEIIDNCVQFTIGGLSPDDIELITRNCLHLEEHDKYLSEVAVQTTHGRILNDPEYKGRIFVNGLFVCNTKMELGYDIKPQYLEVDRDRSAVRDFDLEFLVKDLLIEWGDHEKIAELIEKDAPDARYMQYAARDDFRNNLATRHFSRHGFKPVASNQDEMMLLHRQGYSARDIIIRPQREVDFIRKSPVYQSKITHAPPPKFESPARVLEEWLSRNKKHMRRSAIVAFNELIQESRDWKMKVEQQSEIDIPF